MNQFAIRNDEAYANTIRFHCNNKPVLVIGNDGRIWWNDVEIVTEQEFKEAMIELAKMFMRGVR